MAARSDTGERWPAGAGRSDAVRREIEIEASPEEVWEAVATEEGRGRWLDDDREVLVETVEEPLRLVWWWVDDDAWSRVEVALVPAVSKTRVVVTETRPGFPLEALASAFAPMTVA